MRLENLLYNACDKKDFKTIENAIKLGHCDEITSMIKYAAATGIVEVIKLAHENKYRIEDFVLDTACVNNHEDLVKFIIENDLCKTNIDCVNYAIINNNVNIVKLLSRKYNLNRSVKVHSIKMLKCILFNFNLNDIKTNITVNSTYYSLHNSNFYSRFLDLNKTNQVLVTVKESFNNCLKELKEKHPTIDLENYDVI